MYQTEINKIKAAFDPEEGHMDISICPSCGEECEGGFVDLGVGVTEYWGNVQNHKDIRHVSDCCWADIPEPEFDDYP